MGDVTVRNDHVNDLPPIQLSQDLKESMEKSREAMQPAAEPAELTTGPEEEPAISVQVTESTMENVLKMAFQGCAWYSGKAHIWDLKEFQNDLEFLVPAGTAWVNKRNWAARAVQTAEEESFPIMAGYVFGKRIKQDMEERRQEKAGAAQGFIRQDEPASAAPRAQTAGGGNNVRNVPLDFAKP